MKRGGILCTSCLTCSTYRDILQNVFPYHARHETMRSVREDVFLEGLFQVLELAQPHGGELPRVHAEDVAMPLVEGVETSQRAG